MANIQTMEKIMDLRVAEKNEIEQAYKQSIDAFEKQASALYQLLREKENAQSGYHNQLTKQVKVSVMQSNHLYIQNLEKSILKLQKSVFHARKEMEAQQEKLADAHVEVKKFSKMIEYKLTEYKQRVTREENQLMDEISVRQHMSNEKR